MVITLDALIGTLYAIVALMIIVVLYHLLFIVVDLRKMTRRFEDLTAELEAMLLKPIAILDQGFQWMIDHLEKQRQKKKHQHHVDAHKK
jgi:cell shape-determining protein MreC